jgi:hypothetical protein
VALWFLLPVALISAGTSKLYHYAYPFVPPVALGAGYLVALVVMLAPAPLSRALQAAERLLRTGMPAAIAWCRRPLIRWVLSAIAAAAVLVAAVSVLYAPIRLTVGDTALFKSSGVFRPSIVVLVFGTLAGEWRRASRAVIALAALSALPLAFYRATWPRLTLEAHPMRTATECVLRVESQMPPAARGLYVDVPGEFISHPLYYYFRRVRPWTSAPSPDPAAIGRHLDEPGAAKPMLVWDSTYQIFMNTQASRPSSPPMVALPDVVLLLPGPYAVCQNEKQPLPHGPL